MVDRNLSASIERGGCRSDSKRMPGHHAGRAFCFMGFRDDLETEMVVVPIAPLFPCFILHVMHGPAVSLAESVAIVVAKFLFHAGMAVPVVIVRVLVAAS